MKPRHDSPVLPTLPSGFPFSPSQSLLQGFRIGSKIGLGYAIALGISTLGTVIGLMVGAQVQQRAEAELDSLRRVEDLAIDLQLAVLDVRSNEQRLMTQLMRPDIPFQYSLSRLRLNQAQVRLSNFENAIQDIEADEELWGRGAGVAAYLNDQTHFVKDYLGQLEVLIGDDDFALSSQRNPQEVEQALQKMVVSDTTRRLDEFASQLNELLIITQRLEDRSYRQLEQAEALRFQILLSSMLVSGALAIFFGTYTSRAIARPIHAVTEFAHRVTEDVNFDQQLPVTTSDETGVLAYSLNQLVGRMKDLLLAQRESLERQNQLQKEQLVQAEKMSSLGRMLAGIAHEINNPVNFMYGNLSHTDRYVSDLFRLIHAYEAEVKDTPDGVAQISKEIDLVFIEDDLPKVLQSMQVGADRTRQIVLGLKNFARMDDDLPQAVNLTACIDSTLLILNNRIKHGVRIIRDYDDVPLVEGYGGLLYQVFMNLISNALDTLDEKKASLSKAKAEAWEPTITISIQCHELDQVTVTVADNGCGIAEEKLSRIFEEFYTSKPVGVGTGLGLSITREIIEKKHNGIIRCISTVGQGTTFIISLSVRHIMIDQVQRERLAGARSSSSVNLSLGTGG
ncbi:ATP-binding protein [Vacuolonema iberomarrocanum]|uniref:sensor histidine kinase n=1 Tax=Vacuolonema iberomarrocanum TaxID=3454632 RepID=UPI003F6DAFB2